MLAAPLPEPWASVMNRRRGSASRGRNGPCWYAPVLELEMCGELVIAWSVGHPGDGAERGRSRRPALVRRGEGHLIPGIQAIYFKHKGSLPGQRKTATQ